MIKYITISLIIHLSIIFLVIPKNKPVKEEVEISFQEEDKPSGRNVQVKEVGDSGEGDTPKNHYWGIGVDGEYTYSPVGFAYLVKEVYRGYSADASGINPGDYIFLVNGKSPALNDISGDQPLKLVLQIYRNGVIMSVNTERVKVYY